MALDGIILHKIKEDLKEKLPMRINRILSVSDNEIIFNVHCQKERKNLIVSCHSLYNRICLSEKNYNSYETPNGFIMLLRKYLTGGIIYDMEQVDYDRFLVLKIHALNDMYDEKEYRLYVELMGKYANLILVDTESGKILDALKRIPPFENTKRTIQAGALYQLPEPQLKKDPFLTRDDEVELDVSFVKQFSGFSKLLEQEVRFRMEKESFSKIMEEMKESKQLYLSLLNENIEYHVIPLTHLNAKVLPCTFEEGFDRIYFNLEERERIKKSSDDILKFVKKEVKHFETKIRKLEESYEEAKHPEQLKEMGDLLYTYANLNQKGLKEITLDDFYGGNTTVILDPKRTIKENANRYYQNYHKKKKGQEYIAEQLELAQKEKEYFDSLLEQLEIANVEDAFDIKEELTKYGYLKNKQHKNAKKKSEKVHMYQLQFKEYTITFGKNNIQNSHVSFKFAKPDYTWFHAKDYHGCHLVVDSATPDEETIRLCANLAAYYSKGRSSSSVPVDYCLVKDIKKIKGSKAGFVSIKNQKTIYIDPEFDASLKIRLI